MGGLCCDIMAQSIDDLVVSCACCPVDGNAEHFVDSGFSSCRLAHTFGGLVIDAFVSLSSLGSGARFFASQLGLCGANSWWSGDVAWITLIEVDAVFFQGPCRFFRIACSSMYQSIRHL